MLVFKLYGRLSMHPILRSLRILCVLITVSCAQADKISFDSSSNAGLLLQGGLGIIRNLGTGTTITSFSFKASDNILSQDYPTTINGTNITATIPYGAIARLQASFDVSSGATVKVGGITQISGINKNDFSNPVVYSVLSETGEQKDYTITISTTAPLTDANQKLCYDASLNAIACGNGANPGQDGDFQNGPQPTYVKTVFSDFPNQPVVHDKIAGLVWKQCVEGTNAADCIGTGSSLSYASAIAACSALNSGNGYAGYKNWRLPNIQELYTLSSYQNPTPSPYLNATLFPNSSATIWSATLVTTPNSTSRWTFNFTQGTSSNLSETGALQVRCVVSGAFPAKNYADLGDGTILDRNNNLRWAMCSIGQTGSDCSGGSPSNLSRQAGLAACNGISVSDGKPWRLPNVHELRSLVDYGLTVGNGIIDTTYFKNSPPNSTYMTSNVNADASNKNLFLLDFAYGPISLSSFLGTTNPTRCVKDGP